MKTLSQLLCKETTELQSNSFRNLDKIDKKKTLEMSSACHFVEIHKKTVITGDNKLLEVTDISPTNIFCHTRGNLGKRLSCHLNYISKLCCTELSLVIFVRL